MRNALRSLFAVAVCDLVLFAGAALGQSPDPASAAGAGLGDTPPSLESVSRAIAVTASRLRFLQRENGTWDTRLTFDDAYGAMSIIALNYLEVPGVQVDHEALAERYISRMHPDGGFATTPGDPPSKGGSSFILLALTTIRDRGVSPGLRARLDAAIVKTEHFIAHGSTHVEVESPIVSQLADLLWDTVYPDRSDRMANGLLEAPRALAFVSTHGPRLLGAPLLAHLEPLVGLLKAQQSHAQNPASRWLDKRLGSPSAERALERKLLASQEPDGGWWYCTMSTALNVIALKRQGHKTDGPVMAAAVAYLLASRWYENGVLLESHNGSDLWDTALIVQRLRHATGQRPENFQSLVMPAILAASKDGKYSFSSGGKVPDNDDTAIALATLSDAVNAIPGNLREPVIARIRASTARLLEEKQWDGGFATWGGPVGVSYGGNPPNATNSVLFDAAAPGITSRVLIALSAARRSGALSADLEAGVRTAEKHGLHYLRNSASDNGTWWSRWLLGRLPAFESVPTWMRTQGVTPDDPLFRRGREFLLERQNADGGWGETAAADRDIRAAGRGPSTPVQTALAVVGLIAMSDGDDALARERVQRGIAYILSQGRNGDWSSGRPLATLTSGLSYYEAPEWENAGVLTALRIYEDYARMGPEAAVSRYILGEPGAPETRLAALGAQSAARSFID
jgi:squalene cyclase